MHLLLKSRQAAQLKFSDLAVGQAAFVTFCPTESDLQAYADLSGDYSPLHVDLEFSRSQGFPERVVHGLFTASCVSQIVGMSLPGMNAKLLQVSLSWTKPVVLGDVVKVEGEISDISPATSTIRINIKATNQKNEKVLKGFALVGVAK